MSEPRQNFGENILQQVNFHKAAIRALKKELEHHRVAKKKIRESCKPHDLTGVWHGQNPYPSWTRCKKCLKVVTKGELAYMNRDDYIA